MGVKSVQFPKKGEGYIYQKLEKPVKPDKNYRYRQSKEDDAYQKELEQYQKNLEYYNEHKGEYVLSCSKNLIGKKFLFDDKRINVIFGPNGCGKSTILKAIAGKTLIDDGYSKFFQPLDFPGWFDDDRFVVDKKISELSQNTAKVEWTGNPVYCNNFSNTLRNGGTMIGGIQGSILGDLSDEIFYRMNMEKRASDGQKAAFVFSKVIQIATAKKSLHDILKPYEKRFLDGNNNTWEKCGKNQLEYFKQFEDFEKTCPTTIVLDEVDKSLDIITVSKLYCEIFPMIVEKTGCQIITVSHNPLILSNKIGGNKEMYNLISLEEDYTERAKNTIQELFG